MQRIVFIDRDDVINIDPIGDYVKKWEDFRFEEGALDALKAITDKGPEIILVSNQAGIGDGVYAEKELWNIHGRMIKKMTEEGIRIRGTYYCLHGKKEGCPCRKPETGLFKKAVKNIQFDPQKTYFVGDKATDVEAGKRFGIKTIFVRTGHGKADEPKLKGSLKPDYIVNTLSDAVPLINS